LFAIVLNYRLCRPPLAIEKYLAGIVGGERSVLFKRGDCERPYVDDKGVTRVIIPDIIIQPLVDGDTRPTVLIDVSVINCSRSSCIKRSRGSAVCIRGGSADLRHKDKMRKYRKVFGDNEDTFQIVPIVFESTGYIHPDSLEWLEKFDESNDAEMRPRIPKLIKTMRAKLMLHNARAFETGRYNTLALARLSHADTTSDDDSLDEIDSNAADNQSVVSSTGDQLSVDVPLPPSSADDVLSANSASSSLSPISDTSPPRTNQRYNFRIRPKKPAVFG
jgi:hypothetical protein